MTTWTILVSPAIRTRVQRPAALLATTMNIRTINMMNAAPLTMKVIVFYYYIIFTLTDECHHVDDKHDDERGGGADKDNKGNIFYHYILIYLN